MSELLYSSRSLEAPCAFARPLSLSNASDLQHQRQRHRNHGGILVPWMAMAVISTDVQHAQVPPST